MLDTPNCQGSKDLDKTFRLILEANALLREARQTLESARIALERRENWHHVDQRALLEALSACEVLPQTKHRMAELKRAA